MNTIEHRSHAVLASLTLALALLTAGCGSSSSSSSSSSASGAATPVPGHTSVSIGNYAFQPATITVAPGTKVTFANHDQTAHTATSTRPGFDTGSVAPGKTATVTLRQPGTYTYYCQFHAFMRATLVVR